MQILLNREGMERLTGAFGYSSLRLYPASEVTCTDIFWLDHVPNAIRIDIYVVTFFIDVSNSCCYIKTMIIEFDTAKREKTLLVRGLDFADSDKVFDGLHFIARDDRFDYGEERFFTVGLLDDRMVVIVWTPRNDARRIISMRYANDREISRYKKHLG